MKILYISLTDPEDKNALSGMNHSMYRSLQKLHEVQWIGPFNYNYYQKIAFIFLKVLSKIFKYTFPHFNSRFLNNAYRKNMAKNLSKIEYNVAFAPMASSLICDFKTLKNVIYLSDATFHSMINYYLFNVPKYYKDQGDYIEKQALNSSQKVILCSPWAKNNAINDYNIDEKKISVIGWGPNLEKSPDINDLNFCVDDSAILQLTFIGVDWKRKGGDIVYDCFKILKKAGINCELTIVGCIPPIKEDIDGVTIYPSLNKNKPEEYLKLCQIYLKSNFLIVLSRAECYGLVFCEASAFGVPSIATETGGIPSIITNDVNGYLFPLSTTAEIYANQIAKIWSDKQKYNELKKSSRMEFETKFSWDLWGAKVSELINDVYVSGSIS